MGQVFEFCHPDPAPFRCARPLAGRPRVSLRVAEPVLPLYYTLEGWQVVRQVEYKVALPVGLAVSRNELRHVIYRRLSI